MPSKSNQRHLSGPERRISSRGPGRQKTRAKKVRADQVKKELLKLVQTGVEEFILKHATVEEFLTMVRALSEKEKVYSHQLTKAVFSRIVKEAVRKRNQGQTK